MFNTYMNSYNGQELSKKYPDMKITGTWVIKGEDPNADLCGLHHEPVLGYYSGMLIDVIKYAVNLPGFWQWGAGGKIERIHIVPLDALAAKRRAEKLTELTEAENRVKALKKELGDM